MPYLAAEDTTLANTEVTTKYQEASRIVNATLAEIVAMVSRPFNHSFSIAHCLPCIYLALYICDICSHDRILCSACPAPAC